MKVSSFIEFHFFFTVNKLMIDFGLCWHFNVRSVN